MYRITQQPPIKRILFVSETRSRRFIVTCHPLSSLLSPFSNKSGVPSIQAVAAGRTWVRWKTNDSKDDEFVIRHDLRNIIEKTIKATKTNPERQNPPPLPESSSTDSLMQALRNNLRNRPHTTARSHRSSSFRMPRKHNTPSPPSAQGQPSFKSFFNGLNEPVHPQNDNNSNSPSMRDLLREEDSDTTRTHVARSIFDVFPVPELPPPRSPNAYDEEAYEEYKTVLEQVLQSKHFRKGHTTHRRVPEQVADQVQQWLLRDEPTLPYDLPTLQTAIQEGISTDHASLPHELNEQHKRFLQHNEGWTPTHTKVAQGALKGLGGVSAKLAVAFPIEIAFEKIKESGIFLQQSDITTYIHVLSSYSTRAPRQSELLGNMMEEDETIVDLLKTGGPMSSQPRQVAFVPSEAEELSVFHDLCFEPSEQSVSIRVRMLVAQGKPSEAEKLLDAHSEGTLRLRSYAPVLRLYLEKGEILSALQLFKRMRSSEGVHLEPETYVHLISVMTEKGLFRPSAPALEGVQEMGYSVASGPQLLDELIHEMAEDCVDITSASAKRLYTAFEIGFDGQQVARNMERLKPLEPLRVNHQKAPDDELVVGRVVLNPETGECSRSGAKARLITLEPKVRLELQDKLLSLSASQYGEYRGNARDFDFASNKLKEFAAWLDEREGPPFTAILDGANIAYHMQNFDQGKYNFYQIEFMVNQLEQMNETPLVIMPYKYSTPKFSTVRAGRPGFQTVTAAERNILERLDRRGWLYVVPPNCLDDFYWMIASVSDQTNSRKGRDLDVPTDNPEGRWPGTRPILITNDQMRDHKMELIHPRLFRRWYSQFIVNYNFTAFVDSECVDPEMGFQTADIFSREIQGNPSGSDGNAGTAWHFPVSDWDPLERMCIRIPVVTDKANMSSNSSSSTVGDADDNSTIAEGENAIQSKEENESQTPVSDNDPPSDLAELRVVDLKQMLRERGLMVSGRKADLIKRLLDHNE